MSYLIYLALLEQNKIIREFDDFNIW